MNPRRIVLVTLVVAGLAIRAVLASVIDGTTNSDNAVVALMAVHALRGRFYTFFWGQDYMGSIEALVIAPFFALMGVSDFALSLGLLPWYVLFAVALYDVTRRCGGVLAGAIALGLLACAPPDLQFWQISPHGGYPETLAFGTCMLALALRTTHDGAPPPVVRRRLVLIGLIGGLAFWTDWLVLPYFAVVAVYLLAHDPLVGFRRTGMEAILAFFAGSLPLWLYNLRHGFPTFNFLGGLQDPASWLLTLKWSLKQGLPLLLGMRTSSGVFTFGPIGKGLTALAMLATVVFTVRLWRSWLALARGRIRATDPALSLLLLAAVTIGINSVSLPGRLHQVNYLLPLVTSTLALTALAAAALIRWRRVLGGMFLAGLVTVYALQVREQHRDYVSRLPAARALDTLIGHLRDHGIRFALADYWDAPLATYRSLERVVVDDYDELHYPLAEAEFRDPAVILRDTQGWADGSLAALNARYEVQEIPGHRIYWPIRYDGIPRVPLRRGGWKVMANVSPEDAARVIDGDPWTYWSNPPSPVSPVLTLDLGREEAVAGVFLSFSKRLHEGAWRLRIEASPDGSRWQHVKDAHWDLNLGFERNGRITTRPNPFQCVLFEPRRIRWLRLTLLENQRGYDWSVGELVLFGVGESGEALMLPDFPERG